MAACCQSGVFLHTWGCQRKCLLILMFCKKLRWLTCYRIHEKKMPMMHLWTNLLLIRYANRDIWYYLDTGMCQSLKICEGGTLGFLPKIPFKLTQSIHVACCNFDWKLLELYIFSTKTNKWEIELYFGDNEKNARWHHKSKISRINVKTWYLHYYSASRDCLAFKRSSMIHLSSSNWLGPLFSSQNGTNIDFSLDFDNFCRFF